MHYYFFQFESRKTRYDFNIQVADRLGRNEKTKVIGKLQRPGAGAPAREAAVSEEEKKVCKKRIKIVTLTLIFSPEPSDIQTFKRNSLLF